jgi:hypothetical protein
MAHGINTTRAALIALLFSGAFGCKPYRVEYVDRPAFYEKASATPLPDEIAMDDGTVVKFRRPSSNTSFGRMGAVGAKPFEVREEHEDGSVTLHAVVPEHVLVHTAACLSDEEYELLYTQMLASKTRDSYEADGGGLQGFTEFFRKHRHDLVAMLSRMITGMTHQEVNIRGVGNGVTRCTLRPQIAKPFKFKELDIVKEDQELKLLMIR